MKIKLNLDIFLFLILFFITNQIEIYTLVMTFTLIHELAHLISGVLLGFEVDTFRIMPLGFSIEFKTNIADYNNKIIHSNILAVKKIIIASAGPLFNLFVVIFGIIFNINVNIIYANLLLLLFNLLPIYPLDGGRILNEILKIYFGNRRAYKYTNIIINVLAIVLTIIASITIMIINNVAILLITCVIWIIVIQENKKYSTYNKIYKTIDKDCNYL